MSRAVINGAELWAGLDAETQARIGALAIELTWASAICVSSNKATYVESRPFDAAYTLLINQIEQDLLGTILPDVEGEPGTLPLPSLLGPVCRQCGCSQLDGCDEGCGWAEIDLCSACMDKEAGDADGL